MEEFWRIAANTLLMIANIKNPAQWRDILYGY
jgi:hypothetical protein